MNVLPLVFTVLLVLALFTNAQLEDFSRFAVIKKEYEKHMSAQDTSRFNQRQQALFGSVGGSSKGDSPGKKILNRRLNFALIVNKDKKNANDADYLQHRFLLKELIKNLYQRADFYQEILAKRPQFLDELLDRLAEVADPNGIQSIQNADQLDLKDDELQFVYYNLFKNSLAIPQKDTPKNNIKPKVKSKDFSEDEKIEDLEEEFQAEKGYRSLKEFLHVHDKQNKIGVYSAPQEILFAIFQNEKTVSDFIDLREELFRKKTESTQAKSELEKFKNNIRPEIKEELLDFSVSTTNPKNYR